MLPCPILIGCKRFDCIVVVTEAVLAAGVVFQWPTCVCVCVCVLVHDQFYVFRLRLAHFLNIQIPFGGLAVYQIGTRSIQD